MQFRHLQVVCAMLPASFETPRDVDLVEVLTRQV